MRRLLLLSIFSTLLPLALSSTAEGRSGCCSSHGGVCGCRCCDGTPLSRVCECERPEETKPRSPSGIGSAGVSSSSVSLSWVDNSSGEDSFRIESRTETTSFVEIRSVAANTTSVVLTGLKPETLYFFRVRAHSSKGFSDYTQQLSVRTPAQGCVGSSPCFAGDRFKVAIRWKSGTGQSGEGTVAQLNPTAGTFWFFSASNIEGVFKVVDGCGSNGSFWFFAGGLTNLETTITVTDTLTGRVKTYTNPQGTAFKAVQDTKAFPCQ